MKDPLEELIESAEQDEQDKPWNRWPATWFAVTELIALGLVLWLAWYIDLGSYTDDFAEWLTGSRPGQ